ncbi:MAG: bacillithiol biosynthesis cysteine-adding enzyme BshC [Candidatus Zixiibacteriota bacterium]
MKDTIVKYSDLSGYSKIFLDFNYNRENLSGIFGASKPGCLIKQINNSFYPRKELTDMLLRQNKGWNAPEKVINNIGKLGDEKSVVVTAGQQACLFGGPYLVLLKMLTVLKKAKLLQTKYNIHVIPLFWIASDDHDFTEISQAHLFDTGGEIARLAIDYDKNRKYPPVGSLAFDDSVSREINQLKNYLPENDFKETAISSIEKYYSPGISIIDAFARYWLELLGHQGLVLFNPYDAEVKELCAPFMAGVIDKRADLKKILSESNEYLISRGYQLQVQKPESSTHLFAHLPERTAIHRIGNKFEAGKVKYSPERLYGEIRANPFNFSPDVFMRPLMQSYLFPVLDIIAGPSEIAYLAQMMPLFKLYDLPQPEITARLSATLVEKKFENMMTSFDLQYQDIVLDFKKQLEEYVKEDFPDSISRQIDSIKKSNKEMLLELGEISDRYSFDSKNIIEKYRRKLDYLTGELGKKLKGAHATQYGLHKNKFERMRKALWPHESPPERSIALLYFISRYGKHVIDFIDKKLDINPAGHQLIYLSEHHG